MVQASNSYRKGADWLTIILYVVLVLFGWCNLYAANYNPEMGLQFNFDTEYFKQLVWIGVTFICIGAILLSDSKLFVEIAVPFYIFAIVLLILVLVAGKEVYGAKSWLAFGPVALQPSEFSKLGTALVVSRIVSRYSFRFSFKSYVQLIIVLLLPIGLIMCQPDAGSALVYAVFLLPLFREGLTYHILLIGSLGIISAICGLLVNQTILMIVVAVFSFIILHFILARQGHVFGAIHVYLIGAVAASLVWAIFSFAFHKEVPVIYMSVAAAAAITGYFILRMITKRLKGIIWFLVYLWIGLGTIMVSNYAFNNLLGDHQKTRINVLFGIEDDPLGAGYNVNQSLIAIGSGGVTGKGFLNGTQTKLDFVPKQTTDFIFCTVGEEWGFVGSTFLVIVYLVFFLRIIHLAEKQHSVFSRVYGYCVACVFFYHFTINVCMTIGLMPVMGIPLPFFSYGGSSLWGFSVMLFIFVKLDTDRNYLIR